LARKFCEIASQRLKITGQTPGPGFSFLISLSFLVSTTLLLFATTVNSSFNFSMAHEVLWYAVTVVVAVLGLVLWRYDSSRKQVHMPSAETLAKRTVKKNLNLGSPPPGISPISLQY
jgi:hypothetical protein